MMDSAAMRMGFAADVTRMGWGLGSFSGLALPALVAKKAIPHTSPNYQQAIGRLTDTNRIAPKRIKMAKQDT